MITPSSAISPSGRKISICAGEKLGKPEPDRVRRRDPVVEVRADRRERSEQLPEPAAARALPAAGDVDTGAAHDRVLRRARRGPCRPTGSTRRRRPTAQRRRECQRSAERGDAGHDGGHDHRCRLRPRAGWRPISRTSPSIYAGARTRRVAIFARFGNSAFVPFVTLWRTSPTPRDPRRVAHGANVAAERVDARADRAVQGTVAVVTLGAFVFHQPWVIPVLGVFVGAGALLGPAGNPFHRLFDGARRARASRPPTAYRAGVDDPGPGRARGRPPRPWRPCAS